MSVVLREKQHGTYYGYQLGCRCEACRAAFRAYGRQRYARKRIEKAQHKSVVDAAGVLLLNARSMAAHERDHLEHTEIAAMLESLCTALAEARQQNEQLSDELERVVRCTDECERIRAEMEQQLAEDRAVCLCGCPAADHEQHDDDGESCGRDDHQCLRVCRAVADLFAAAQAQEIAKLKQEVSEHLDYMSQASTAVREIQDAQREQDAQQLDNAAAELDGTSRVNSNIARILHEEAAKMRAARTPQEPT